VGSNPTPRAIISHGHVLSTPAPYHASRPLTTNGKSLTANGKIDFKAFQRYLHADGRKNVNQVLSYARRYSYVLESGNASELLTLTKDSRRHAMAALSVLSKYCGVYQSWKEIRESYQLKWSETDSVTVFKAIIGEEGNFPAMMKWFKDARSVLPESYSNILLYNTLTGLRAEESIHSIGLVKMDLEHYLKGDILEHFQFPDLFIRRTKKAYISLVDERTLDVARQSGAHTYVAIHKYLEREGLPSHLKYCRKIFSTHLRMSGIEAEIVDLLQGRIPNQLFVRHYFRPDFDKVMGKIRKSLDKLYDEIV
jgi:hypothetical protein